MVFMAAMIAQVGVRAGSPDTAEPLLLQPFEELLEALGDLAGIGPEDGPRQHADRWRGGGARDLGPDLPPAVLHGDVEIHPAVRHSIPSGRSNLHPLARIEVDVRCRAYALPGVARSQ